MEMILEGRNNTPVDVNDEFQLVTRSIIETELEHSSNEGASYSWDSGERDIDAGDTMLFVKNTGDVSLIFDEAILGGSNVVCTWEFYIGALTDTPIGSVASETNLNENFASRVADAIAMYDETAVANGSIVSRYKTSIGLTSKVNLDGIILGKNHYLQVNQLTESTSGSVILIGHYAAPS